ncbi:MAG TPA: hypothetical protein VFX78_07005 [Candidatus Eisenbacteria bacterium]|jgi:hypothetical protein|nr:hypothetical protein [Candidatus Eisenbacteria bacterium]
MSRPNPEQLGPPSVSLGAFQLWVHGREFPKAKDRWDGNWLNVTAHCGGDGASVWASGAILDTVGLRRFRDELTWLQQTLAGKAVLASLEPYVGVLVKAVDITGRLLMEVNITPDPTCQSHHFEFEVDPGLLPATIAQLESLLDTYPVRGMK